MWFYHGASLKQLWICDLVCTYYGPLHAESKRALYDSSGRSAVYAAERRGRTQGSPFRGSYAAPRARSGWSNFWYQQQQYSTHGASLQALSSANQHSLDLLLHWTELFQCSSCIHMGKHDAISNSGHALLC